MIAVPDTMLQNIAFFIALAVCVFLFRGKNKEGTLGRESTLALKGFAILAIIFSHIGYFLVADHSFLFPRFLASRGRPFKKPFPSVFSTIYIKKKSPRQCG